MKLNNKVLNPEKNEDYNSSTTKTNNIRYIFDCDNYNSAFLRFTINSDVLKNTQHITYDSLNIIVTVLHDGTIVRIDFESINSNLSEDLLHATKIMPRILYGKKTKSIASHNDYQKFNPKLDKNFSFESLDMQVEFYLDRNKNVCGIYFKDLSFIGKVSESLPVNLTHEEYIRLCGYDPILAKAQGIKTNLPKSKKVTFIDRIKKIFK